MLKVGKRAVVGRAKRDNATPTLLSRRVAHVTSTGAHVTSIGACLRIFVFVQENGKITKAKGWWFVAEFGSVRINEYIYTPVYTFMDA